jgi:GrpB-like predicted nucleotidyltransferase (UPF0157 family)
MPMRIVVVPHDSGWHEQFNAEAGQIATALGPNVVAVHHIGSTAIPTIYAKPILDLLVEVAEIENVDDRTEAMHALGYEAMGEFGIVGRRFFRKDDATGTRTHHVHAFTTGSNEVVRHLAFRDYLLACPDWAERYSTLKRELAAIHADDAEGYMDGKDPFIKEVERLALEWRRSRGI